MNDEIRRFDLARKWILEAGKIALFYYQKSLDYTYKNDGSVVTKADLEIEQFLRKKIALNFPNDSIIGEEFENISKTSSVFTWTVDPIDGTYSFANKLPLFGNLIGLMKNELPIMGLIYCPTLKEGIFTLKGYKSVWLQNNKRSRFSCLYRDDFSKAIISSSGIELLKTKKTKKIYQSLLQKIHFERSYGDCYGHLLVATGRVDFMFDANLKIWDYVPLIPILEESGGKLFVVNKYKNNAIAAVSCHLNYKNLIQEVKK